MMFLFNSSQNEVFQSTKSREYQKNLLNQNPSNRGILHNLCNKVKNYITSLYSYLFYNNNYNNHIYVEEYDTKYNEMYKNL